MGKQPPVRRPRGASLGERRMAQFADVFWSNGVPCQRNGLPPNERAHSGVVTRDARNGRLLTVTLVHGVF